MNRIARPRHWLSAATVPSLLARGLAVVLLAVAFSALPRAVQTAYAAPLEDCDADGFDDATGVPVPWPGYDETHGDTPAGPGTASWWIEQNQGSTGGGSTSPGGSTNPGSGTDSGSGSGNPAPTSGAGGSKDPGRGGTPPGSGSGSKAETPSDAAQSPSSPGADTSRATDTTNAPTTLQADTATDSVEETTAVLSLTSETATGNRSLDSSGLWGALTAGFGDDNDDRALGLALLGSLGVMGVIALGASTVKERVAARG